MIAVLIDIHKGGIRIAAGNFGDSEGVGGWACEGGISITAGVFVVEDIACIGTDKGIEITVIINVVEGYAGNTGKRGDAEGAAGAGELGNTLVSCILIIGQMRYIIAIPEADEGIKITIAIDVNKARLWQDARVGR